LPRIGVLAIQGDVIEHRQSLGSLGVDAPEIRLPVELDGIDGLIIPGGESTTIAQLIDIYGFRQTLREKILSGMPVWGTCAGMIILASRLTDSRPEPLALMDIEVSRNVYGRQVDSFEEDVEIERIGAPPFHAVFIRAPGVNWLGQGVEVLGALQSGQPVVVQQGSMLATSFHPELIDDSRIHGLFTEIVEHSI